MRVWLEEAQGALAKASGIDTLGLKVLESEKLEARPLEQEDCAEQRRNRIADSLARCRPLPEHCAAQLRLQELHCSTALRRRGAAAPQQARTQKWPRSTA